MIKFATRTRNDGNKLFGAMATAVVVADHDLRITRINTSAENLLALSAAKLVGSKVGDVFVGAAAFVDVVKRAIADGRTFTERDLELTPISMCTVVVDCTVTPWIPERGDETDVLIEMTSVERHQRIQLEENMLIQNQVTTALMRGLAHEVKNPLGGIRGAAQLLERELEDQRLAEYTQIIIGEADRLRTLVDKMLGPHAALERQSVNIHDVLEHVRQLVDVEYVGAVEITRDYDPSLPELVGDRDQLIQAFLNLLSNAARAVSGSSGSVTVRTRIQRKFTIGDKVYRNVIRVDVIDTGPGVPAEIADSIFYPMVSGHADGSGLGLPLAQAMINRQGGLIGFNSRPGYTEFNVWLPLEFEK